MNLYTHAMLARTIQPRINLGDPAAYVWGAVEPDIRYNCIGARTEGSELSAFFRRFIPTTYRL
jgi:hypothetical protein